MLFLGISKEIFDIFRYKINNYKKIVADAAASAFSFFLTLLLIVYFYAKNITTRPFTFFRKTERFFRKVEMRLFQHQSHWYKAAQK